MSELLRVEALRAGFGANTVLHGVDFTVHRGEVSALLGLNGAGKSVTLKVIGGLVPAWDGRVWFNGDDITRLSVEERVRRGIAHVPQGRHVFPGLTVEHNLRLGAYVLRRRDRSRYRGVLDSVYDRFPRLAERRTQLGGTMSGGEQAMLAVGRALMAEPTLMLVDEPTAGLAPVIADSLVETFRTVKESGVTLLVVEQNVPFALRLADRIHVMQRGAIAYEAPTVAVDHAELVSHLGIGRLLAATAPENGRVRGSSARRARLAGGPRA